MTSQASADKKIQVLLVEDDATIAQLLKTALERPILSRRFPAFAVNHASRLSEAFALLDSCPIDVVLLDLGLPDSDDLETFKKVHERYPEVPILILTATDDEERALQAIQHGAQDYLIKTQVPWNALSRIMRYAIERKQSQESVYESQRFLQGTLDALSAHIAVLDEKGEIIAVNRAWEKFAHENLIRDDYRRYGVGANYLQACDGATGAWAETGPVVADAIRMIIVGKRAGFSLEYPCHAPAEERWFNVQVTQFDSQEPVRVVVAHENITTRKLADRALRVSEERFQTVSRATNEAIWDWDFLQNTLWWNHGYSTMFGYSNQQLEPGIDFWSQRVHPEDVDEVVGSVQQTINSGEQTWQHEYRFRRADGQYADVLDRGFVIRSAEGKPLRMIGSMLDITERKRNEEALRQARDELEARVEQRTREFQQARDDAENANRAKGEFLSRMSHELRTPLNAILGFAQLLEMQETSPSQVERTQHILRAGRHLLQLINEVLDVSRVEAGKIAISMEPIGVRSLLNEALEIISPLAAQRGLLVHNRLSETSDCYVLADRQRLKQVLLNLLSNAVKYNRQDGSITVDCTETASGKLCISVSDTGSGISEEDQLRLFQPFERLGADNTAVEGTGLGLALAKRLAELMHGSVRLQSTLGTGSTFSVELAKAADPLVQHNEEAAGRMKRNQELPGPSLTILAIEDNPSNLMLIESILEMRPGIELLEADCGSTGFEIATARKPNLILLDLHLPDCNGEEILVKLKKNSCTRDIPVVIVSADAMPKQIDHLKQEGAVAYLTKPLDVQHFLDVLDEALNCHTP